MIIGEIIVSPIIEVIENTLYIEVSFFSLSLNAAIIWNIANIIYATDKAKSIKLTKKYN